MIKVVIIEDEIPARKKLIRFFKELNIQVDIIQEIDTVAKGVQFLQINYPDIIYSDIELLDGNAFNIFEKVSITCPIIFTTAYDQFWTNAFETNGIAYLLKPFSKESFQQAWNKFILLRNINIPTQELLNSLLKRFKQNEDNVVLKKRFMVHDRNGFYFIDVENIVYFEANQGVIFAYEIAGKKHILTVTTLKEIEEQVGKEAFFRINRSELVHKKFIEKVERNTKNSLAIKVTGNTKKLITSQQHTALFRDWIQA